MSESDDRPLPVAPPRRRSPRAPRRWLPYAGGGLLLGLIIWGLWPEPVPVELARVSVGTLRATVAEEGKTRIRQRYVVAAPVPGQLRRITLDPGDEVRGSSTVVATLEPLSPAPLDARSRAVAEARREAAMANVDRARAAHEFAMTELRRLERLFAAKTITQQELENVQWREISTARDQAAAESALRQVEVELREFAASAGMGTNGWLSAQHALELKAPVSGRILRVFEDSARPVTAGLPLVEIGDPADLEVVIDVLSRDGASILPGMAVELAQWGGAEPLAARVRLVEPAAFTKVSALGVEEQRVNVIADLVTPPDQRPTLGDAFRVEARIIVWAAERALKVPAGALFRRGDGWAALVVANGRVRSRAVTAGRTSGTETQILEGLKEGEQVVLYPGDRVRDGKRVKAIVIGR